MSKDHILELGALVQLLAEHMEYCFYLNEPCRPMIIGRLCFGPAQPGIMATSECPSFCSLPLFAPTSPYLTSIFCHSNALMKFKTNLYKLKEGREMKASVFSRLVSTSLYEKR